MRSNYPSIWISGFNPDAPDQSKVHSGAADVKRCYLEEKVELLLKHEADACLLSPMSLELGTNEIYALANKEKSSDIDTSALLLTQIQEGKSLADLLALPFVVHPIAQCGTCIHPHGTIQDNANDYLTPYVPEDQLLFEESPTSRDSLGQAVGTLRFVQAPSFVPVQQICNEVTDARLYPQLPDELLLDVECSLLFDICQESSADTLDAALSICEDIEFSVAGETLHTTSSSNVMDQDLAEAADCQTREVLEHSWNHLQSNEPVPGQPDELLLDVE